jgi:probable rRNA maturation factor
MNVIEVELEDDVSQLSPLTTREVSEFARQVLDYLGISDKELSVMLCSDAAIQEFNRNYRAKDEPTDVLSFSQSEGDEDFSLTAGAQLLGDIVISLETVRKNAEIFGVSHNEEFSRLLIHGILHLIGMDHISNAPDEQMLIYQEQILKTLQENHDT